MVCCGLIKARIELERTQDMHNGTVAQRSHIPSRSRRHEARALVLQPPSRHRACALLLAPEAIRPLTERPRGDRTDVFVRGKARPSDGSRRREMTRREGREREVKGRSDGAHPLGHWFHGDAQSPSATALHRPWCQSFRGGTPHASSSHAARAQARVAAAGDEIEREEGRVRSPEEYRLMCCAFQ